MTTISVLHRLLVDECKNKHFLISSVRFMRNWRNLLNAVDSANLSSYSGMEIYWKLCWRNMFMVLVITKAMSGLKSTRNQLKLLKNHPLYNWNRQYYRFLRKTSSILLLFVLMRFRPNRFFGENIVAKYESQKLNAMHREFKLHRAAVMRVQIEEQK